MKFNKIQLTNFRAFKSLDLELHPQLNVIAGINGAGKTTVLDACAMFMSYIISYILNSDARDARDIHDFDIRNKELNLKIIAYLQSEYDNKLKFVENRFIQLNKKRKGHGKQLDDYVKFIEEYANFIQDISEYENENIPVFAYYGVNRALLLSIHAKNTLDLNNDEDYTVFHSYMNAMEASIDFSQFYRWYEIQDSIKNEHKYHEEQMNKLIRENEKIQDSILYLYRELKKEHNDNETIDLKKQIKLLEIEQETNVQLIEFYESQGVSVCEPFSIRRKIQYVQDVFKSFFPNVTHIEVVRNQNTLFLLKSNELFDIRQLSDGEKILFALIMDLTQRLLIANPKLENPLEGSGVVLIDEIELHLHPTWQREVMNKLTEIFPNIQFIITTHSPQVISETRKENLFLLSWDNQQKQPVITKPSRSFGLDSTTVLNEIMDSPIYNKQVQQQIDKIFQSIDDEQYEQVEKLIKELENDCDGEIPETVRAKTYLNFWRA